MKTFKSWELKFVQPTLSLERENPKNLGLQQTVRVFSKTILNTTNFMASDPQVWLLSIIWYKIGVFWYVVTNWETTYIVYFTKRQVIIKGQIQYF